jgi:hypothetical protein
MRTDLNIAMKLGVAELALFIHCVRTTEFTP